jgi:hypothetical protein
MVTNVTDLLYIYNFSERIFSKKEELNTFIF